MTSQIIFPSTHGKDTALYALDYQRAILSVLAYGIENSDNPQQWLNLINLCQDFANTAYNSLLDEKSFTEQAEAPLKGGAA